MLQFNIQILNQYWNGFKIIQITDEILVDEITMCVYCFEKTECLYIFSLNLEARISWMWDILKRKSK